MTGSIKRFRLVIGTVVIYLIALSYFFILQFASGIMIQDPENYFHLKMAELIAAGGLVRNFPWIGYGVLSGSHYTDHEFLFHLLVAPFTRFDSFALAQWAGVFLPSLVPATLYWVIARRRLPVPAFWALSFLAAGFSTVERFMHLRAYTLSVPLSLLTLDAVIDGKRRRAFLLSFLHAWIYLLSGVGVFLAAVFYAVRRLRGEGISFKIVLACAAGWAGGLILHPYFPYSLTKIYPRILPAAASVWSGINLDQGMENLPLTTQLYALDLGYVPILAGGLLFLMLFCRKTISSTALALLTIGGLFFAGSCMSRRVVEYAVPLTLYACAFCADDLGGQGPWRNAWRWRSRRMIAVVLLSVAVIGYGTVTYQRIRDNRLKARPTAALEAGAWLKAHTEAGDLVFNCAWDDFGALFYSSSQNRYLTGLEPAYFYADRPELYRQWD
ncbi:MAG: hypothetical protein WCG06_01675, partial [Candidatus Omnitrophota bacterium]